MTDIKNYDPDLPGAWLFRPPGSDFGPCVGDCGHIQCDAIKRLARCPCTVCLEPIGYDRATVELFPHHDKPQLAHADCAASERLIAAPSEWDGIKAT